jgi:hypothetical protein
VAVTAQALSGMRSCSETARHGIRYHFDEFCGGPGGSVFIA